MSVSVVVVTFNRLQLLKECLNNLLKQSNDVENIFVVNNHSTDNTKEYLNKLKLKFPIVKPINTKKNLGGAGGFSLGTQIAFEKSDSEYFWLMDDDTMPSINSLSELCKYAKRLHNNFGYLCSNVRWWKDCSPSYMNVPIVSKDWTILLNEGLVKTVSASFVSLFISREVVSELGLPIADMFIWGDDVEYTTRLSKYYPSYLVSNSIVLHKSKTNTINPSVVYVPINRLIYYKCMFRNRLYISRKYYKLRKTLKIFIMYTMFLFEILAHSHNHKFKRFMYTLEGIVNGLFFNPTIKFPHNK